MCCRRMVSQAAMRGQRVLECLNPTIWLLVTLLGSLVFMAFSVLLRLGEIKLNRRAAPIDDLQFLVRKHYQVQLANGLNRCEGRVEVYYNGTWGTVCDDDWDMLDAQVICQQLDCGVAVAMGSSSQHGQTSIPIVLDNVDCKGSETNLGYCDSLGWGIHNCYHYEDVAIKCREPLVVGAKASGDVTTPPPKNAVLDGTVRLVDGVDSCQGRVEIYHQGRWGTVCDDDWDAREAEVVCRQLGCGQVISAHTNSYFGYGTGHILLDNVNCVGNEEQLGQCTNLGWSNHNCGHHEDAGITCSGIGPTTTVPSVYPSAGSQGLTGSTLETAITNDDVTATELTSIRTAAPTEAPMAVRVASGYGSCRGRVEVQYNDVWGTVCDDGWDMPNAIVVCRQLGCGVAIEAKSQASFGYGSGPILLDNVQCTGDETHLSTCTHSGVGQHNCGHHEDAGVVCTPMIPFNGFARDFRVTDEMATRDPTASTSSTEGALRLVDGQHECEGRLEMYLNSGWGTVCDDAWDIPDAKVACRQLGCGEAVAAWGEARFGQGTGTILFDNLKCNGTEFSLQNCSHIPWNVHNCDHSEDAGVTCSLS
ncbi:scavenger receptor cysteine-rich domain-containing group B protein isoform X2 [Phyllopteryx taeniolatus]|uniref:scavenger receptor cysteine-rich domain-containing group B protein isoform X2 n=1 Tax=Phyllopteryx taeniolatus TaxID=161469 RepID=UPI002AD34CF4|nr:scavenger receptor cysteine-rich domain-containing group B protein isoform X2 [Phyllopteryx taeniolatus]